MEENLGCNIRIGEEVNGMEGKAMSDVRASESDSGVEAV